MVVVVLVLVIVVVVPGLVLVGMGAMVVGLRCPITVISSHDLARGLLIIPLP